MGAWFGFLLTLGGVYMLTLLLLWQFQEHLVFYPQPVRLPPADRAAYANWATSYQAKDDATLRGWLRPADAPQGAEIAEESEAAAGNCRLIIYYPGNAEEVSHLLPYPRRAPYLYMNYRGYGDSDGRPSADSLRADALAVFDETVRRTGLQPRQICLLGRSLGSHMAIHVAANRAVEKLVIIAPFTSVTDIAKRRYPIFPVRPLLRHPFDSAAEADRVTADTLVLLAESDGIIPHDNSRQLLRDWPTQPTVHILPNTDHNNMPDEQSQSLVEEFLAAPVAPTAGGK